MRNIKILSKINALFLIISLIAILLILVFTQVLYRSFYLDHQVETLSSHGHILAGEYETNPADFHEKVAWSNQSLQWQVIFTDNPMLLSGGLPSDIGVSEHLISFEERQTLLDGDDLVIVREHERLNQNILAVVVPIIEDGFLAGAIFLYTPLSTIQETFQPLLTIMTLSLVIFLLIILGFALIVTRYIVKPIKQITSATNQFAAGDFGKRIQLKQKDEIGQLADSFNSMADSLEKTEENRREFLGNVSHELRTPISNMKGYTEAVEENIVDRDKYIAVMKKETARIGRLVDGLLDLARLEGDASTVNLTPLPFSQVVIDVVDNFTYQLKKKELTIHLELDEGVIVNGDADRLAQVVTNLLQNACRYSEIGATIEVRVFEENEHVILQVEDHGVGIPKESLPKVTERFYRVNKARTSTDGGTGIGLAIVQQITKKHGGEFIIQSTVNEGTIVTIKLPAFDEH